MEDKKEILNPNDLIELSKVDNDLVSTAQEIINETSPDKLNELINLFNIHETKKSTVRAIKYNTLLDSISDEMLKRFDKYHNEFSNDDILKYLQASQLALDKINKNASQIKDIPQITINQVNINQTDDTLDRESREKVAEALKAIMAVMNNPNEDIIEPENIIIEESELKGEPLLNGDDGNNNNQN